jgi:hypothetical protein
MLLACLAAALGSVVFATAAGASTRGLIAATLAFAATVAWPPAALVPSATGGVALAASVLAVGRLAGWGRSDVLAAAAGWLAAVWATLLSVEGVPLWGAALLALALPCAGAACVRRDQAFAPPRLLEDALVVVALVSVCAAAAPGLVEGWHAAVNLKMVGTPTEQASMVPAWAVAISLAAIACGAGIGVWSKR